MGSVYPGDKLFAWVCVHDTARGVGVHHGFISHQSEETARFDLSLMLEEHEQYRTARKSDLLVHEVEPAMMAEALAAQGWGVTPPASPAN